jgi:hypothetical protein
MIDMRSTLKKIVDWILDWFVIDEAPRARHANGHMVRAADPAKRIVKRTVAYSPDERTVVMSVADLRDLTRLRTAESLRRAEEATMVVPAQSSADMGWESYERLHRLREALDGIGHVGPQFDSHGKPVGNQLIVSLTAHEAEALILKVSRDLRKTIASLDPQLVHGWETAGA